MRPILFEIPGIDLPIHAFGVMVAIGWVASLALAHVRVRRTGFDTDLLYDMAFWIFLSAFVGARLVYVVQYWEEVTRESIWHIFALWRGGIVSWGGFVGGFLAGYVFSVRRGMGARRWEFADAIAPSLLLGMGFGRIGCFLNGCCWGKVCDAAHAWCVAFPPESGAYRAMRDAHEISPFAAATPPLVPTQPISSVVAFLLCGVLLWMGTRRRFPGQVFAAAVVLYCGARFSIEFLRNDTPRHVLDLTFAQWAALGIGLTGTGLYGFLKSRHCNGLGDPA